MSKKAVVAFCIVLVILIIFGVTFFLVDFNLVVRNEEPKFCINTNVYNDGTTKEYVGIGYKIIRYNISTQNSQNKFGTWFLMYDKNLDVKEEEKNIVNYSSSYDIIGEITSIDDNELAIVVKSTDEKSKHDEAIVKISSSTIISRDGKQINKNELNEKDKVRVKFDGIVTMSIPPQATAISIEVTK